MFYVASIRLWWMIKYFESMFVKCRSPSSIAEDHNKLVCFLVLLQKILILNEELIPIKKKRFHSKPICRVQVIDVAQKSYNFIAYRFYFTINQTKKFIVSKCNKTISKTIWQMPFNPNKISNEDDNNDILCPKRCKPNNTIKLNKS